MATRKTTALDGGLIARKGQAAPAAVPTATSPKDPIAVTVRLDPELSLRLKRHEVSFRPWTEAESQVIFSVGDSGVGFPPGVDFRHTESLGLQLICLLTEQLGGTVALETSEGTRFTIRFSV